MLRVFKRYEFGDMPAVAMSSFPGVLASADDFYQLPHLVVLETTITVYNNDLLRDATPSALPYWIRAMTANYMAASGPQWMEVFKRHNSGTYNNMWMVVDYSKFTPGAPLPEGLFTVGEQLPGFFHYEDQTHVLSYGYWPSYNVAMYPKTRQLSGQADMEQHDPMLSYQEGARAQVFRRDQATVESDEDMQRIMRYNRYQTDPLARGNTCNQLACRKDLPNMLVASKSVGGGGTNTADPAAATMAFGAIDAKYTNFAHMRAKRTIAISGPTHDDQPVFDWTQADLSVQKTPHVGQPDRFDFDWVVMLSDMEAAAPMYWPRSSQSSNSSIAMSYFRAVALGGICLVVLACVTYLSSKHCRQRGKDENDIDWYHQIGSEKKVVPDMSPGLCSTHAGSVFSPTTPNTTGASSLFSPLTPSMSGGALWVEHSP